MIPEGGFFSSLFKAAKRQSGDVYGKNADGALRFYLIFALAAVAIPVAFVAGFLLVRMTGVFG